MIILAEYTPNIVLISAAVGGTASALINLIAGFIMRHLESKRKIRELAITVAFESWRHHNEIKVELAKDGARGDALSILPADSYVAHALRIVSIAGNTKLSPDEAAKQIYKLGDDNKTKGFP